jgi:putative transposase
MIQAIKIKLYPSDDQIIYINKLLGTSRFIYNQCLNYKINKYKETKKSTSLGETGKFLTSLKFEYQWIKESHSKVLQQSLLNLDKAYKNFFRDKKGFPRFKSKHSNQSCKFPVDAISGVKGNRINIIKTLNDIHYKCSRRDEILLNKYQSNIKSGTLSKDKTGNYYFSILIDISIKTINKSINGIIGIDLGIKDFIVDSNGNRYSNFHFKKIKSKKLNRLHRSLSRKQNKSNNKNKARIKLARTYNKINHQKEYYLHQMVNQLLGENQTIVMEDLNVKGMIKNHKLAESIQEVSWNRFKQILLYKASWYGRNVIFVDRWFASSKTCNHCGYKHDNLKLSDRLWICQECGTQIDRDHNASLNIRDEGVKILKLGMSLPEVTPTESSSLESRGSRKKIKIMKEIY